MAPRTHNQDRLKLGSEWLLRSCPNPTDVQRAWAADSLAAIPSGVHWLAAEAAVLPTVEAMGRLTTARSGPVLADTETQRAWWLVPLEASEDLADVRQITVHPPGWPLLCPPVDRPAAGRVWLERPDGTGHLTNPVALGAAFGPGGRLPAEAFG